MSPDNPHTAANSETQAVVLMLAITVILGAMILAMILTLPACLSAQNIPQIFIITSVQNVDEITGSLNYDSRVGLIHTGTQDYQNKNLKAVFYRNGAALNCRIVTMNGHDFISTIHTGVQWMGGSGCTGNLWSPAERTTIDLTDGTFHPGDTAQIDIIDTVSNTTISRHLFTCA